MKFLKTSHINKYENISHATSTQLSRQEHFFLYSFKSKRGSTQSLNDKININLDSSLLAHIHSVSDIAHFDGETNLKLYILSVWLLFVAQLEERKKFSYFCLKSPSAFSHQRPKIYKSQTKQNKKKHLVSTWKLTDTRNCCSHPKFIFFPRSTFPNLR